ncbi:MAG: hypothetical protein E3K36_15150 [Candidatus Brocadia sp.]|nr:hypothetical protein [Candidatus Brocadia sp.]
MSDQDGTPIFEVWDRYENIAKHFNDLLIKLRTQALGGVAAITSIGAILSKNGGESGFNWAIMAGVFFFLNVFWVAVWILDFKYYNQLLRGSVDALLDLEKLTQTKTHVKELDLSTKIEDAVAGKRTKTGEKPYRKLFCGIMWFYFVVLGGLLIGLALSIYKVVC